MNSISKRLKIYLLFFILITALSTHAQKIKLNYEPQGKVVKFYFDGLTIYTDTTSLINAYVSNGNIKEYDLRVINFIRKEISTKKADTVVFSSEYIPLNDNVDNKYQKDWYVKWAILQLLKKKMLKIYDKHNQLVKIIMVKKVGKKRNNYVKRSYINKTTNEELFNEVLFFLIVDPSF